MTDNFVVYIVFLGSEDLSAENKRVSEEDKGNKKVIYDCHRKKENAVISRALPPL